MYGIDPNATANDISYSFYSSQHFSDNMTLTGHKFTPIAEAAVWIIVSTTKSLELYCATFEYAELTGMSFLIDYTHVAEQVQVGDQADDIADSCLKRVKACAGDHMVRHHHENKDSCAALFLEKPIANAAHNVSFAEIASQVI
jgi:hypothetical protein